MIQFPCECGKPLRVRPELAGKRVKCPSCGAVATVPAAGESEPPAPARAAAPVRPAVEDAAPERPPVRRRKSAGAWTVLLGGLAVLLLAGGGVAAVVLLVPPTPDTGVGPTGPPMVAPRGAVVDFPGGAVAGPPEPFGPGPMMPIRPGLYGLDLVPAESSGFATLGLAAWWSGEHGKRFRQKLGGFDLAAALLPVLGVPPDQVERLTVVAGKSGAPPVVLVSTRDNLVRERVLAALVPQYELRHIGVGLAFVNSTRSLVFIHEKAYVYGPGQSVTEFLAAVKGPAVTGEGALKPAAALADKHLLVAAVDFQHPVTAELSKQLALLGDVAKPLRQARLARLTLDAAPEPDCELLVTYPEESIATTRLADAQAALELIRGSLGDARHNVPKDAAEAVAPLFDVAEALLKTAAAEQDGAAVRVKARGEAGTLDRLAAALPPLVKKLGEAVPREQSANNLRQIAVAFHSYAATLGKLPPAAITDKDGKPLLSWRVALLPYLGRLELYNEFRRDEPWDSEHNKQLLRKMPQTFAAAGGTTQEPGWTYYRVFTGPETLYPGPEAAFRLNAIPDGTSNTILAVEAGEAVPWTKPDELAYDAKQPLPLLGGLFKDGFHAAMADGSVRFIKKSVSEETLRNAIRPADGNVLGKDW